MYIPHKQFGPQVSALVSDDRLTDNAILFFCQNASKTMMPRAPKSRPMLSYNSSHPSLPNMNQACYRMYNSPSHQYTPPPSSQVTNSPFATSSDGSNKLETTEINYDTLGHLRLYPQRHSIAQTGHEVPHVVQPLMSQPISPPQLLNPNGVTSHTSDMKHAPGTKMSSYITDSMIRKFQSCPGGAIKNVVGSPMTLQQLTASFQSCESRSPIGQTIHEIPLSFSSIQDIQNENSSRLVEQSEQAYHSTANQTTVLPSVPKMLCGQQGPYALSSPPLPGKIALSYPPSHDNLSHQLPVIRGISPGIPIGTPHDDALDQKSSQVSSMETKRSIVRKYQKMAPRFAPLSTPPKASYYLSQNQYLPATSTVDTVQASFMPASTKSHPLASASVHSVTPNPSVALREKSNSVWIPIKKKSSDTLSKQIVPWKVPGLRTAMKQIKEHSNGHMSTVSFPLITHNLDATVQTSHRTAITSVVAASNQGSNELHNELYLEPRKRPKHGDEFSCPKQSARDAEYYPIYQSSNKKESKKKKHDNTISSGGSLTEKPLYTYSDKTATVHSKSLQPTAAVEVFEAGLHDVQLSEQMPANPQEDTVTMTTDSDDAKMIVLDQCKTSPPLPESSFSLGTNYALSRGSTTYNDEMQFDLDQTSLWWTYAECSEDSIFKSPSLVSCDGDHCPATLSSLPHGDITAMKNNAFDTSIDSSVMWAFDGQIDNDQLLPYSPSLLNLDEDDADVDDIDLFGSSLLEEAASELFSNTHKILLF